MNIRLLKYLIVFSLLSSAVKLKAQVVNGLLALKNPNVSDIQVVNYCFNDSSDLLITDENLYLHLFGQKGNLKFWDNSITWFTGCSSYKLPKPQIYNVINDSLGNFYFCVAYAGYLDVDLKVLSKKTVGTSFDPRMGPCYYSHAVAIFKINRSGEHLWTKIIGGYVQKTRFGVGGQININNGFLDVRLNSMDSLVYDSGFNLESMPIRLINNSKKFNSRIVKYTLDGKFHSYNDSPSVNIPEPVLPNIISEKFEIRANKIIENNHIVLGRFKDSLIINTVKGKIGVYTPSNHKKENGNYGDDIFMYIQRADSSIILKKLGDYGPDLIDLLDFNDSQIIIQRTRDREGLVFCASYENCYSNLNKTLLNSSVEAYNFNGSLVYQYNYLVPSVEREWGKDPAENYYYTPNKTINSTTGNEVLWRVLPQRRNLYLYKNNDSFLYFLFNGKINYPNNFKIDSCNQLVFSTANVIYLLKINKYIKLNWIDTMTHSCYNYRGSKYFIPKIDCIAKQIDDEEYSTEFVFKDDFYGKFKGQTEYYFNGWKFLNPIKNITIKSQYSIIPKFNISATYKYNRVQKECELKFHDKSGLDEDFNNVVLLETNRSIKKYEYDYYGDTLKFKSNHEIIELKYSKKSKHIFDCADSMYIELFCSNHPQLDLTKFQSKDILAGPNPTNSILFVQNVEAGSSYFVTNSIGVKVKEGNIAAGSNLIHLEQLIEGEYIFHIPSLHFIFKFVKI